MAQSKELTDFYRAYLYWVEDGAKENQPFTSAVGLCNNAAWQGGLGEGIKEEMRAQFVAHGLDAAYPFGMRAYDYEYAHRLHAQPERMQWVRDRLAEAEQS